MTCTRCQGRLLKEHIYKRGAWWWRCYNCGDRVDANILYNRAEQEAATADRQAAQQRDLREWATWFSRMLPVTQPVTITSTSQTAL